MRLVGWSWALALNTSLRITTTWRAGLNRVSDLLDLEQDLETSIYTTFPGDADAADNGTMFEQVCGLSWSLFYP